MENVTITELHKQAFDYIDRVITLNELTENESVQKTKKHLIDTLSLLPEWAIAILESSGRNWLKINENNGDPEDRWYEGDYIFTVTWWATNLSDMRVAVFEQSEGIWEGATFGRNHIGDSDFESLGGYFPPEDLVECLLPGLEEYHKYGNAGLSGHIANKEYIGFYGKGSPPNFNYGILEQPRFSGEYKKDIHTFRYKRRKNNRPFEIDAIILPTNIKKGTYPFGWWKVEVEDDVINNYDKPDCHFWYFYLQDTCYISLIPRIPYWKGDFNLFDPDKNWLLATITNGEFEWNKEFIPLQDILKNKEYVTPEYYSMCYYLYGIDMEKDSERYKKTNKDLKSFLINTITNGK